MAAAFEKYKRGADSENAQKKKNIGKNKGLSNIAYTINFS